MGTRAKKIALSVVLCAALLLCSGGVALADDPPQVFVIYVGGDKLVYDAIHDVYFYPHLLNMLNMTKAQQEAYADQLNAQAYGQITDWHFANLEQMMGLLESMFGQKITHPGPNRAYGMNTEMFFPVTDVVMYPSLGRAIEWTMGRTIDEAGVYIEVPTGMPYPGVFVETSWSGDVYLTVIPTEGQYHWAGTVDVTFDDDLNWVADDAFTAPMIGKPVKCSAWYVSETGPRPTPNSKYLHSQGSMIDINDPLDTQWHELWPIFCREYHLSGWEDNGDGVLSPCDRIDMYEKPDGGLRPYHVENVTITLLLAPPKNVVVDENDLHSPQSPPQGAGKSMYIELEGGYNPDVLMAPNCTYWHEIYPEFCTEYHLVDWVDDGEPLGELSFCDYIALLPKWALCPLDEDFSVSWPPSGWTQEEAGEWQQSSTSNAGGASPEAGLDLSFFHPPLFSQAYLDSKPIDTTGRSSLTLEFKSFIDNPMPTGYNCRVYTRAHGGDGWSDVTPWPNPIVGNQGPGTYQVDISSDIGTGTQVRFDFNGWAITPTDYWYLDDVKICSAPEWWHVEDVAIDIVVTPEPPPVGGEAYPVSKVSLLAPWIAVGLVLAGGISWYILRRRRAKS